MLHAQILPVNIVFCLILLLSPSCYRWFTLVPGGSNLDIAGTVPSCKFIVYFVSLSISLEVVSPCSRWFQLVPRDPIVIGGYRLFQVVAARSSLFQVVPASSRWFQLIPGSSTSFQVIPA